MSILQDSVTLCNDNSIFFNVPIHPCWMCHMSWNRADYKILFSIFCRFSAFSSALSEKYPCRNRKVFKTGYTRKIRTASGSSNQVHPQDAENLCQQPKCQRSAIRLYTRTVGAQQSVYNCLQPVVPAKMPGTLYFQGLAYI